MGSWETGRQKESKYTPVCELFVVLLGTHDSPSGAVPSRALKLGTRAKENGRLQVSVDGWHDGGDDQRRNYITPRQCPATTFHPVKVVRLRLRVVGDVMAGEIAYVRLPSGGHRSIRD